MIPEVPNRCSISSDLPPPTGSPAYGGSWEMDGVRGAFDSFGEMTTPALMMAWRSSVASRVVNAAVILANDLAKASKFEEQPLGIHATVVSVKPEKMLGKGD